MTDDKMPPNGNDRTLLPEPEDTKPEESRRPDRSQANTAAPSGQRVQSGRGPLFRA